MKRMGVGLALAAALALAAVRCGGSSSTSGGTDGGTDGGTGGTSSSQLAFIVSPTTCPISGGGQNGVPASFSLAGVFVGIADREVANGCSAISTGCTEYKNLNTTIVGVANFSATGTATAVAPGTYTVSATPTSTSGTFAFAARNTTNATCDDTSPSNPTTSGTVTITSVSSSAVAGTYNVTINGTNYTGSFNAPVCSTTFGGNICNGDVGGTCTGTKQCI